jgi:hypothetical protein
VNVKSRGQQSAGVVAATTTEAAETALWLLSGFCEPLWSVIGCYGYGYG